ncbi:Os09g0486900, partial [Oryza sativa Japonica Group]
QLLLLRLRRRLVKLVEILYHAEPLARGNVVGRRRDVRRPGELAEQVPRDSGEERVGTDLVGAAGEAEPLRGLLVEQPRDEVGELRPPPPRVGGELRLPEEHVAERLLPAPPPERRPPVRHLVDEHAERPPVDGELVPLAPHHLRRHVLLRAHERE